MVFARIRKFLQYFRRGGIHEVLLRLAAGEYLPVRLLCFNEAQILRLERRDPGADIGVLPGYEYQEMDRRALDALLACSGPDASPHRRRHFEGFFDQGVRCHAIKHAGAVVAYCWTFSREYVLTFDGYRRRNIAFPLDANAVFVGNVYVAPAHRHRGVFSWLLRQVVARHPEGTRFYSWVERTNDISLLAHRRLGFAPLFSILCVSLFGLTGYWRRDAGEKNWRRLAREESGGPGLGGPAGRPGRGHGFRA